MGNSGTVIQPFAFHSNIEIILDGTDEEDLYETMVERIIEKIATFQSMGSGWRLHSIIRLELHTVRYKPVRGKSYIPLPGELNVKKAIINMKNDDNQCFLWCVLRALNPKERNPKRVDTGESEGMKSKTQAYPSRYSFMRKKASIHLESAIAWIGIII